MVGERPPSAAKTATCLRCPLCCTLSSVCSQQTFRMADTPPSKPIQMFWISNFTACFPAAERPCSLTPTGKETSSPGLAARRSRDRFDRLTCAHDQRSSLVVMLSAPGSRLHLSQISVYISQLHQVQRSMRFMSTRVRQSKVPACTSACAAAMFNISSRSTNGGRDDNKEFIIV